DPAPSAGPAPRRAGQRRRPQDAAAAARRARDVDGGGHPSLQALHRGLLGAGGRRICGGRIGSGRERLLHRQRRHAQAAAGQVPLGVVRQPAGAGADGAQPHDRGHDRDHRHRRHRARGLRQMSALSEHVLDEIRELPAKYPQHRSAVMPALDLAQEELGYLTPEAMSEVASALQLDPGYVEGVATFYTLFHLEPIGKHRFYMCTNLSCTLRGAEDVVDRLKDAIGVREPGEVSKDGMFSYEEVECLGACEYAPVCRLDHRYEVDLTRAKIDSLVN